MELRRQQVSCYMKCLYLCTKSSNFAWYSDFLVKFVGPNDVDPCSNQYIDPALLTCRDRRTYYFPEHRACVPRPGCPGDGRTGFETAAECESTCLQTRSARRVPNDINFKMLSDFEWTPPSSASARNSARRKYPLPFCELQRDNGIICTGIRLGYYLEQFYYDSGLNQCVQFVYNGCGGNANRFSTIWECVQSCSRKTPMIWIMYSINLKLNTNPCMVANRKIHTGQCNKF